MLTGVIDIGSNSVRLMMWQDGKTLYKEINTTRLGEGTALSRTLLLEAMERTVLAVSAFAEKARREGAEDVLAFATEAVRSASNRTDFLNAVKDAAGLEVDVLSGETEAVMGAVGALSGGDGVVIDVGGASVEVTCLRGGKVKFARSFPVGCVRIYDVAGRDYDLTYRAVDEALSGIDLPMCDGLKCYSIGGTATSLAAVALGLETYDPAAVDGYVLGTDWLDSFAKSASLLSVEEVKAMKGMDPRRADVIGGGAQILVYLARRLRKEEITVSEADNLEGYMLLRGRPFEP
ncbi:MAG: hypothetical protein LUD29_04985 [Clostridia bacterium]|nr:hypothetical protein [Clostridia bacterium]